MTFQRVRPSESQTSQITPPVLSLQPKGNDVGLPRTEAASRFNSTFVNVPIHAPRATEPSQPQPFVQPKLTIGQAGDRYEQEADQVAQQVGQRLNQPQPLSHWPGPGVQRVANQPARETSLAFEGAIAQSRGRGQALPSNVQGQMEQAFGGVDFRGVRVHTDGQSDQLNRSIQAKAFTTGQDIYFRQGSYEPSRSSGQSLLAHELTHVVQQNGLQASRFPATNKPQTTTVSGSTVQRVTAEKTDDLEAEEIPSSSGPTTSSALPQASAVPKEATDKGKPAGQPEQKPLHPDAVNALKENRQYASVTQTKDAVESTAQAAQAAKAKAETLEKEGGGEAAQAAKAKAEEAAAVAQAAQEAEKYPGIPKEKLFVTFAKGIFEPFNHPDWKQWERKCEQLHTEQKLDFLNKETTKKLWVKMIVGMRNADDQLIAEVAEALFPLMRFDSGKMGLWSGSSSHGQLSEEVARAQGYITLESQQFYGITNGMMLFAHWDLVKPVWASLSRRFVTQAQGEVHVFLHKGIGDIFRNVEAKVLENLPPERKVQVFYHILHETQGKLVDTETVNSYDAAKERLGLR